MLKMSVISDLKRPTMGAKIDLAYEQASRGDGKIIGECETEEFGGRSDRGGVPVRKPKVIGLFGPLIGRVFPARSESSVDSLMNASLFARHAQFEIVHTYMHAVVIPY